MTLPRSSEAKKVSSLSNSNELFSPLKIVMDVSTQTKGGKIRPYQLSRSTRGVQVEEQLFWETWPEDSNDDDSEAHLRVVTPVICGSVMSVESFGYILRCLACSWKPSTYDENVSHQEVACQTDYCESLNDYYEDKIVQFEEDDRRFIAHITYRPALSNLTSTFVNKVTL